MTHKIISVKMIPCVEIRGSSIYDKKEYFFNKQFKMPGPAAKHWAFMKALHRTLDLEGKGRFASPLDAHHYQEKLEKKLFRRAKPIFVRLLATPK